MTHRALGALLLLGLALRQGAAGAHYAADCPVEQRTTTAVRLGDSRAIYVEPMAFAAGDAMQLHAGHPVYVWTNARGGSARLDSSAAVAGVLIRDSIASALPSPFADDIATDFRLRAEDGGHWFYAIFARATAPDKQGHDPKILSYWFGRTDGVTWDSLEALPLSSGPVISREASQLLEIGGSLMLAVPFSADHGPDVAVYVRERGRWRMDVVSTHGAAYVALAASGASPRLYVVRPDTANVPDANSLSLFTRDNQTWRDRGFLLRGGRQPIHHPFAQRRGGLWTLSWITHDDASQARTAHAARIARDGTLARHTLLAETIVDLWPVQSGADPARWIATTRSSDQKLATLLEWSGDAPTIRDVVVDPFEGSMLVHPAAGDPVAVGPVLNRAPGAESLVSASLRFTLRCNARARGGPDR